MSWFGGGGDESPGQSLYAKYAPGGATGNAPTRSSHLRQAGVRLNCYLNVEGVGVVVVGGPKGHGTIVQLPAECDTLEEVLPHIQKQLKLDQRMCYAADLFLPDGQIIEAYDELVAASKMECPIIVGCGEPFDASRVPKDLLSFFKNGGGRSGVLGVIKDLQLQREDAKRERAEAVREDGHGVFPNSLAVVNARTQAVEANREKAAYMRQRYLEGLVKRTEEEQDYLRSAQANIMFHKMEEEEGRARREEYEMERQERLLAERQAQKLDFSQRKNEDNARIQMLHAKVKEGKQRAKEKNKLAKDNYRKCAKEGW